mmetsp:Transcript_16489/g.25600  ORF Transcript_16489/g.25600 Transcript_16489/m.25600 type:complete len:401 (+) Transcript_16489:1-1203(+)
MYFAFMTCLSLLGLISSPIFFVFYMVDYFRRKDGRLVLESIIVGGPNLVRSFILGMIVIVCFGFFTYAYFSHTVNMDQDQCHSPWQCVTKHILDSMTGDLTTVLGNDLGVWQFSPMVPWKDGWYSFRTLFVFISLIFWVFLLQGIIQGQIIDAFAAMRSESNAKREDLDRKCFVSSVERTDFNDYPGEWEKRQGGKYAWNYLLYLTYLERKDMEDYNGIESWVWLGIENDSAHWLPVGVFFASQHVGDKKDSENTKLAAVNNRLGALERNLKGLERNLLSEVRKLRMSQMASQGMGALTAGGGSFIRREPRNTGVFPNRISEHQSQESLREEVPAIVSDPSIDPAVLEGQNQSGTQLQREESLSVDQLIAQTEDQTINSGSQGQGGAHGSVETHRTDAPE